MSLWNRIKGFFGSRPKSEQLSGTKKNVEDNDEAGNDVEWKVEKKPHPYEEVELPNDDDDDDDKPQEQYKVVKTPRAYEEIVLPNENNDTRLSQKKSGGELNYIDVEFSTKTNSNIVRTKSIPPSVEYTEVTVQNSNFCVSTD